MESSTDPAPLIVLAVVAAVVVIAVVVALNHAVERRYSRTVAEWAAARGWRFREGGGGAWASRLPKGVRSGVRLEVEGTVTGVAHTYPVTVAHYWWQTQHQQAVQHARQVMVGKQYQTKWETRWETRTVTHDLTVHVVRLPRPVPQIAVEPRGLGSRAARSVGLSGGRETGDDQFDRKFKVETAAGPAESFQLPAALLRAHCDDAVPLWSAHGHELLSTQDHKLRPATIDDFTRRLVRVADSLAAGY